MLKMVKSECGVRTERPTMAKTSATRVCTKPHANETTTTQFKRQLQACFMAAWKRNVDRRSQSRTFNDM